MKRYIIIVSAMSLLNIVALKADLGDIIGGTIAGAGRVVEGAGEIVEDTNIPVVREGGAIVSGTGRAIERGGARIQDEEPEYAETISEESAEPMEYSAPEYSAPARNRYPVTPEEAQEQESEESDQ